MAETLVKQVQFLKESGFTEQQANAMIYFQRDNVENIMATKKDIADVKKDIEQLRADLTKDIEQLRADTKRDIEQLRADLTKEIAQLRADTKRDIADVRKDIALLKKDMILKLGSIVTAGVVILGLLIKL